MQLETAIRERRSIRRFTAIVPPRQWIDELVSCASQAPSPSNRQPVRLVQIASDPKREALYQALNTGRDTLLTANANGPRSKRIANRIKVYYRYSAFMFDAPWLFAIATPTKGEGFAEALMAVGLPVAAGRQAADTDISVGLFVANLLYKATALGLGTCVLTAPLVFMPNVEVVLGLDNQEVKCFVIAGFPAETPAAPPRLPVTDLWSAC